MKRLAREQRKQDNQKFPKKELFWYNTHMLPKEYRLKRMKDFEILFKEGWFVSGEMFTAKVWKINVEKYPRRKYTEDDLKIGLVVGLKVSKSAVKRNRLKRQMREVVRLALKNEKLRKGFMVAIIAKPVALGKEHEEIEKDIVNVLEKAKLFV